MHSRMKLKDSKFESIKRIVRVRDDNTTRIDKLRLDKNEYIGDLPKDVMNLVYKKLSQEHINHIQNLVNYMKN